MDKIRKYFNKYTRYNPEKWLWVPYIYAKDCSLEEQSKWNDLYQKTRMRKSDCTKHYNENNDIVPPDFYSQERDAAQFNMREYTVTDTFGLKWFGKKGCEEQVGAPDYEGHLYYFDEDYEDEVTVSEYNDSDNQPDPLVFQRFEVGYPHFRTEWLDIANIKNVQYHYYLENHLFKDSKISITYDDSWTDGDNIYDNKLVDFVKSLKKFGKTELYEKLMKQINEHFDALKNSEHEDERHFWPGCTAEEYFSDDRE